MLCVVKMVWDDEAGIWYTESDDIPGLVLHARSFDALVARVRVCAPELMADNRRYTGVFDISFEAVRVESGVESSCPAAGR